MNKNIEVEGGEIAILNSHGDLAIIPKDRRNWVKQKLSEGCHNCIDSLVETLPIASQYAQDGSVYPPNTKVKVNQDNQVKEYDISSPEYKDLYDSGKLTTYDKNTDSYIATPLKEVTITAEAPQWLKYKREYEKNNPKKDYINKYLTPFAKSLGNTETNYPKRLDAEYEQKSLDYIGEQLFKNKPQGKLSRVEWLNQMSDKEEEIIKRNPKYQSSLWADTKRGLTSLVEKNPLQTFQNILNSSDYTNREKREMLIDYIDHPIMSKLGDATKVLNPLTVPSKMVQSAYKDGYSFTDALKGKKNNAGIAEDIVTDPLNLVGVGLASKLSKADKVIDATKTLNKTDDIVKSSASLVDDAAYPVTRTTPNSGYTFKTISPNKDKIAIHESNKYHDLMWVAKNDIDNFFINNKIDVSKLPESKLVGSEVGYDWILPEGITHDMLNEFARLHHGKPITQEMRNIAKAIKEANPNVKFNGTSHELHGIASNIHPEYLGKMGQGLSNVGKVGSKVLNKEEAISKLSNINVQSNQIQRNGFFFDTKGFMQKYPKGKITQEEINAIRKSPEYLKWDKEMFELKAKYGDSWTMKNPLEEALEKGDRGRINEFLYGGDNYKTGRYILTGMLGYITAGVPWLTINLVGTQLPQAVKKKIGANSKINPGLAYYKGSTLSSRDTIIDITDKQMDYAKINEYKEGKVLLGGEFIEDANNSVRKASDWKNVSDEDTFSDKKIKSKSIEQFYGIEGGKFKVGKLKEFNDNTEVVPIRFNPKPISKAVLNGKEMRIVDKDNNPIYQNTPNTGKFILTSPSTKRSVFVYINSGESGVEQVNKFLKENKDAYYIHLDNGRYEFYGVDKDVLTKNDFEDYYKQDLKRDGNPGYNLIIK